MAETTIGWTATVGPDGTILPGYTYNLWRGCTKLSAGCRSCYAETLSNRNPSVLGIWGPRGTRAIAAPSYETLPHKWNDQARASGIRRKVFCSSLADVFEGRNTMPESAWEAVEAARTRLWATIEATPHLDWLVLTKRPENIATMLPARWEFTMRHNLWLGTSAEDQATADERIPLLLAANHYCANTFVSFEPLLGPITLRQEWLGGDYAIEKYREPRLSRGGERRTRDRLGGPHMASGVSPVEQVDEADGNPAVYSSASGKQPGRVSPGASHDRQQTVARIGAPTDLASLSRRDTANVDNQPQEREQTGQSAREPRVSDLFPTGATQERRSGERAQTKWRNELNAQTDRRPSGGDTGASGRRDAVGRDREAVQGVVPGRQQNRSPRTTGITWCIIGGESGSKARPMDLAWAEGIVTQVEDFTRRMPSPLNPQVYMKQLGTRPGIPGKGEHMADFPSVLQLRQWPTSYDDPDA